MPETHPRVLILAESKPEAVESCFYYSRFLSICFQWAVLEAEGYSSDGLEK
jgi:hypothetical protein